MKSICNRTRVTDPSGIWEYKNMIGAKVRISSMPVSNLNFSFAFNCSAIYTVDDVYFRVTTDGKTITIIRLKEIPDYIFTWKDLEVINIQNISESICGLCYCGQTICGN